MAADNCDCVDYNDALFKATARLTAKLTIGHNAAEAIASRSSVSSSVHHTIGPAILLRAKTVVSATATNYKLLRAFLPCNTTVTGKLSSFLDAVCVAVSVITAHVNKTIALRGWSLQARSVFTADLYKQKLFSPIGRSKKWRTRFKRLNIEFTPDGAFTAATKTTFSTVRTATLTGDPMLAAAGTLALARRTQALSADLKCETTLDKEAAKMISEHFLSGL